MSCASLIARQAGHNLAEVMSGVWAGGAEPTLPRPLCAEHIILNLLGCSEWFGLWGETTWVNASSTLSWLCDLG